MTPDSRPPKLREAAHLVHPRLLLLLFHCSSSIMVACMATVGIEASFFQSP